MFHIYTVSLNAPTVIGHYMCVPSTLIYFPQNLDVLMKTLGMLITHVFKISRKFIEMALEKMNRYAHVAA